MAISNLGIFEKSLQKTNELLDYIQDTLELTDRKHAYHALRSVLHALRDRLPVNEAADLGEQLPLLVRGIYYEGWQPARMPLKMDAAEFLAMIQLNYGVELQASTMEMLRAVWEALQIQVSQGEIGDILANLPKDLKELLT